MQVCVCVGVQECVWVCRCEYGIVVISGGRARCAVVWALSTTWFKWWTSLQVDSVNKTTLESE